MLPLQYNEVPFSWCCPLSACTVFQVAQYGAKEINANAAVRKQWRFVEGHATSCAMEEAAGVSLT